jgi:hypothetical protein
MKNPVATAENRISDIVAPVRRRIIRPMPQGSVKAGAKLLVTAAVTGAAELTAK